MIGVRRPFSFQQVDALKLALSQILLLQCLLFGIKMQVFYTYFSGLVFVLIGVNGCMPTEVVFFFFFRTFSFVYSLVDYWGSCFKLQLKLGIQILVLSIDGWATLFLSLPPSLPLSFSLVKFYNQILDRDLVLGDLNFEFGLLFGGIRLGIDSYHSS